MNIVDILEEIEKVDGEVYERFSPRRTAMKEFFNVGKKISLAAVPLALGSMFNKAYGQSTLPANVKAVLQFALTLEHFEAAFYTQALKTTGGADFSGSKQATLDKAAIGIISAHETSHVNFLKGVIGADAVTAKPSYDWTASGAFPNPFAVGNYGIFLAVAQALEDTGVRAYKGQAPALVGQGGVLEAALNIHSVEARHAAKIRYMRAQNGVSIKPWITGGNDSGVPNAAAVYAGEENVIQAGLTITGINGTAVTANAASESFDEPLTTQQVLDIVKLFGVS
ncbi:ferritin-like domain-containing protein [Pedobacter sp. N36a]|uniref:ferritin-like domain-containing protein n=1 Tax=Pedobacter sp. N36a TaxID=2767996 RepID=UPI0016569992|nr:ferritin-like domain-containing protein [Pedobacter sp. N36a]MBC8984480.1 ferritin-like domain-containing protein [Pedobacter sp. N36a]